MKIMICETFSCSKKDYLVLPDKYYIELCFIGEDEHIYLKIGFYDEEDEEIFYAAIPLSQEFLDVVESIRRYPYHNVVLDSMLEKVTTDFQTTLTSSVGSVVVFDLDKFIDSWLGHLNEQLADYRKKHFK